MKHRRHRRVGAKGVTAQIDDDDCNIENISVGGLFIRTSTPMPIGMPVRVDLAKPGVAASLQLSGRVVSVVTEADAERLDSPAGNGIELDPLPPESERQLHALLRELGLQDLAAPTEIEPNTLNATTSPDPAHAASNVRGLLDMLSDALQKVRERDREILALKAKIRKLETGEP